MEQEQEASVKLWEDECAQQIEALWSKVFESSNKVLLQHRRFGFTHFDKIPRPNVHDMLIQLKVFGAVFDVLMAADLEYSLMRQLLNAKQQITNMERVALAVKQKNSDDYHKAVKVLDDQAPF